MTLTLKFGSVAQKVTQQVNMMKIMSLWSESKSANTAKKYLLS